MIVTIDGPSGTGKTTVARKVAERLSILYFDTGAMYRAVTWVVLKEGIDLNAPEEVNALLEHFSFDIRKQNGDIHYFVGEEDVTEAIRTQIITDRVSEVAAIPMVRETLWKIQRIYGSKQPSVFEGRDMGSVVFPDAGLKIFLTAKPKLRAQRRLKEMRAKLPKDAENFDHKSMEKELRRRDRFDSKRKLAPLKRPKKAHRIDTSKLSIDQVVEKIVELHHKKAEKLIPGWLHSSKMRSFYRFILFLAWLPFKIFYKHKVYGLDHFVKSAGIIAPNHTSYMDPPLVAISWPEEVHFLARDYLFEPFLFGRLIRSMNSHPVRGDVGDVTVFKTILELLKQGKQLILFPEGLRTGGQLEEIKPGIGMLLMRSKAMIIPTYIYGAHTTWPREKKFPKLFGKTACVYGSPIRWESFVHLEKKEAQVAIAKRLSESILALKDWYDSGAKGIPP